MSKTLKTAFASCKGSFPGKCIPDETLESDKDIKTLGEIQKSVSKLTSQLHDIDNVVETHSKKITNLQTVRTSSFRTETLSGVTSSGKNSTTANKEDFETFQNELGALKMGMVNEYWLHLKHLNKLFDQIRGNFGQGKGDDADGLLISYLDALFTKLNKVREQFSNDPSLSSSSLAALQNFQNEILTKMGKTETDLDQISNKNIERSLLKNESNSKQNKLTNEDQSSTQTKNIGEEYTNVKKSRHVTESTSEYTRNTIIENKTNILHTVTVEENGSMSSSNKIKSVTSGSQVNSNLEQEESASLSNKYDVTGQQPNSTKTDSPQDGQEERKTNNSDSNQRRKSKEYSPNSSIQSSASESQSVRSHKTRGSVNPSGATNQQSSDVQENLKNVSGMEYSNSTMGFHSMNPVARDNISEAAYSEAIDEPSASDQEKKKSGLGKYFNCLTPSGTKSSDVRGVSDSRSKASESQYDTEKNKPKGLSKIKKIIGDGCSSIMPSGKKGNAGDDDTNETAADELFNPSGEINQRASDERENYPVNQSTTMSTHSSRASQSRTSPSQNKKSIKNIPDPESDEEISPDNQEKKKSGLGKYFNCLTPSGTKSSDVRDVSDSKSKASESQYDTEENKPKGLSKIKKIIGDGCSSIMPSGKKGNVDDDSTIETASHLKTADVQMNNDPNNINRSVKSVISSSSAIVMGPTGASFESFGQKEHIVDGKLIESQNYLIRAGKPIDDSNSTAADESFNPSGDINRRASDEQEISHENQSTSISSAKYNKNIFKSAETLDESSSSGQNTKKFTFDKCFNYLSCSGTKNIDQRDMTVEQSLTGKSQDDIDNSSSERTKTSKSLGAFCTSISSSLKKSNTNNINESSKTTSVSKQMSANKDATSTKVDEKGAEWNEIAETYSLSSQSNVTSIHKVTNYTKTSTIKSSETEQKESDLIDDDQTLEINKVPSTLTRLFNRKAPTSRSDSINSIPNTYQNPNDNMVVSSAMPQNI